jgi:hypothetical protein
MGTTKECQERNEGTVLQVGNESDPVMAGFLGFIEAQMTMQPEDIAGADADQLRRIGKLVKGVKAE